MSTHPPFGSPSRRKDDPSKKPESVWKNHPTNPLLEVDQYGKWRTKANNSSDQIDRIYGIGPYKNKHRSSKW